MSHIISRGITAESRKFSFGLVGYELPAGTSKFEVVDQLGAKLSQLEALIMAIRAEGLDTFDNMSADLRQNYLWSLSECARECKDLAGLL